MKLQCEGNDLKEKSAAVFAVRRANYTHRRKGVFNVRSIEDLKVSGNVRYRTEFSHQTVSNTCYLMLNHTVLSSRVLTSIHLQFELTYKRARAAALGQAPLFLLFRRDC